MKLELLKKWVNVDDVYNEGQKLEISDETGKQLIEEGIAKEIKPKAGDVIVLREVNDKNNDDLEKNIESVIDKTLEKLGKKTVKPSFSQGDVLNKTANYDEFWQFASDIYRAGEGGRSSSDKLRSWDKHCKTAGHMNEGEDAQGGYLIPEEFRATLLETLIEASLIRGRATVIPMSSNTIKIPSVNDTSHTASTHGGIILYRPGEAAAKTASKPTFAQIQLTLHKLCGLIYVSDELLEDSPISIQPLITRMFTEAFAWQEDEDFINGTGANQPLGILNAPCLVTVAKETGQPGVTIVSENIDKMWARLHPRSQANSVWIVNNDCWPQLARLERPVGTGGSTAGLVQSLPNSPFNAIYGRPIFLTEHCQTLGTLGDILLCDWRQYLIGQKAGASAVQTASSIHLKFDYDETAFRFVMRFDGQPWPIAPLTPKHSTNTLSPFVALATRAV